MLFMVIERFRNGDIGPVGERFQKRGRMMPDDVRYIASWIVPDGSVCYQLMEAPDASALTGWTQHWDDLVDFEVIAVEESAEFWARRRGAGT